MFKGLKLFSAKKKTNFVISYNKALNWIKANTIPEKGIIVTSKERIPYLEVTGYTIPTLINAGEMNLAHQYAEFLSYMQRPNGSFAGPDGKEYVFDTAQALDGLLKASEYWGHYLPYAEKAANYVLSQIGREGQIHTDYQGKVTQNVHLFVLPQMIQASKRLNNSEYEFKAMIALNYFKQQPDILDVSYLTHFLGYIQDGFIRCGEKEFILPSVKKIFNSQKSNGSITAYPHVPWVCSTGLIQLAIVAYKCGMYEQAENALRYAARLQNSTGGFFGSYGKKANYFAQAEIAWANKFFIDAIHLKIVSFFNKHHIVFPDDVSETDQRLQCLYHAFGNMNFKKVLDVGCGKGRFSEKIKNKFSKCEVHGVDASEELLNCVPGDIETKKGSVLNLPYETDTFDFVFCIETLEHSIRYERAVEEIVRVLKPNGIVCIIDKNVDKFGKLETTDFEQWFYEKEVGLVLENHCVNVTIKNILFDDPKMKDLFFVWTGQKKAPCLTSSQWYDAVAFNKTPEQEAESVRKNQYPVWIKPLLKTTQEGDHVAELGSGTGKLCSILSLYKREVSLLDYSQENLHFSKQLFKLLDIKGNFYCGDVFKDFPFAENSVDWVFSSGLLEHFEDYQIKDILRKSYVAARKGVISLVPNYNSIFYQFGKYEMITNKNWSYGREVPKCTMRPYFESVGLRNIHEISLGTYHSLEFFPDFKALMKEYFDTLEIEELHKLNQGYLLLTIGEKYA